MMLGVRLPDDLDQRLAQLAEKTHRPKSFYVKEALAAYLDIYEKDLSAIAEYEDKVRKGTLKTISLENMIKNLGFQKDDVED